MLQNKVFDMEALSMAFSKELIQMANNRKGYVYDNFNLSEGNIFQLLRHELIDLKNKNLLSFLTLINKNSPSS